MATATKTLHGSRVFLTSSNGASPIACFDNIAYGVSYDHIEPYILGLPNAGEVVLAGMSPVSVQLSGFRKVDESPYSITTAMTKLQDFFNDDQEFDLVVTDRVTGKAIATIHKCKAVGHRQRVGARGAMSLEVEVVGLMFSDETGTQSSPPDSPTY